MSLIENILLVLLSIILTLKQKHINMYRFHLLFLYIFLGVFRHRFTVAGKYCYWSDYCDVFKTTFFRGCVNVVDRPSMSSGEVSLTMGQFVAEHVVNLGIGNSIALLYRASLQQTNMIINYDSHFTM